LLLSHVTVQLPCLQAKGAAARLLGLGNGSAAAPGATHVFCLGIGFGVHRAFLDGAPYAYARTGTCRRLGRHTLRMLHGSSQLCPVRHVSSSRSCFAQ